MGRYIQWEDVVTRYNTFEDIAKEAAADDDYIPFAENYIDGVLGEKFTVPFSSNNQTAKDLAIDATYAKTQMFRDPEKSEAIMTHINSIMGALKDGSMKMIIDSGQLVEMSVNNAWSETEGYAPVFGKGDITDFKVDSGQLYDEEQDRL